MSGDTVAAPICTDSEAVDLDALEALVARVKLPVRQGMSSHHTVCADGYPFGQFKHAEFADIVDALLNKAPAMFAELRTLRAQPSATLGGVTVTAEMVREAMRSSTYTKIAARLTAALSLQNATPDARGGA